MLKYDLPYFLMRITLGAILLAHGLLLKIIIATPAETVGYLAESYNIHPTFGYLVIFGETVGGLAIMFGIYSRLAALLAMPILFGAFLVHVPNGWLFSNAGGGWEFPLALMVLDFAVILGGNGIFAFRKFPILDWFVPDIFKG